jgi:thiamine biosynthesis lipoprotein
MSTYRKDSEISRFNRFKETGQKFKISADFFQVMTAGQTIYRLSEGAWDATVNPLVDLWGFGQGPRQSKIPPPEEIAALLPDVGFSNIEVLPPGYLLKKRADVTVDLSSIAKGYGVDQVAYILLKNGFEDYLVEIGGEIIAAGHREDGRPWRIGINRPQADAAFDEVYKVVGLRDQAFATSGDYRNFFVVNGIRYSHVIDPRTGYPVTNGVVSVSIITDNCTLADGLATAVMVMGVDKGLNLINRLARVEGLIIVEKKNGTLVDHYSKGFK